MSAKGGNLVDKVVKMAGTVFPREGFCPKKEAERLRKAVQDSDENVIMDVLGSHPSKQRLQIAEQYKAAYRKELIEDLKETLGGDFENLCVALLTESRLYDARELNKAVVGLGTDETALVEIMCTRNNAEIKEIKEKYKAAFGTELAADLKGDTSGPFCRMLLILCEAGRESDDWWWADEEKATADAKKFLEAGQCAWGPEKEELNKILCLRAPGQLRRTIERYKELSGGITMEEAIKSHCSGDLQQGYLAIVESMQSPPRFFARRLNESVSGLGTSDNDLIRIIVSRCEIDCQDIKKAYQEMYKRTLEDDIKDDCSGNYKKLLLVLITPKS